MQWKQLTAFIDDAFTEYEEAIVEVRKRIVSKYEIKARHLTLTQTPHPPQSQRGRSGKVQTE